MSSTDSGRLPTGSRYPSHKIKWEESFYGRLQSASLVDGKGYEKRRPSSFGTLSKRNFSNDLQFKRNFCNDLQFFGFLRLETQPSDV